MGYLRRHCESRKTCDKAGAEKLECFLTNNVNPLHCCEMHSLLSNQNKQPITSLLQAVQAKNDVKLGKLNLDVLGSFCL